MKIKDREYLYASARVRALERQLINRDAVERMIEAESVSDAIKVLAEFGYSEFHDNPKASLEQVTAAERARTFALIRDISPNPEIVNVFSIKYDYHNIKALIKSAAVNQPAQHLLIDAGRVPADELYTCLQQMELSPLPWAMREACADARDTLSRTGDAQIADFILDRACFDEMLSCAKSSGSDFLLGYVRLLIDATNLRTGLRAQRQGKSGEQMRAIFFDGGNVSPAALTAEISTNGSAASLFNGTRLEAAAQAGVQAISGDGGFTVFERMCDDALTEYLQGAKYLAFGDAPPIAYLAAKENELCLIRILLAAKLQKLPAEEIRERLRVTYV